jgi:hypothetical protein
MNSRRSSARAAAALAVKLTVSEAIMRMILLISIALLLGTFTASAQSGGCEKYCREKRCADVTMQGKNWCMQKCIPNCEMINQKKKGK